MKTILAYHPEIIVEANGTTKLLTTTLPDYQTDAEILTALMDTTKTSTIGELIEQIELGKLPTVKLIPFLELDTNKKIWTETWPNKNQPKFC